MKVYPSDHKSLFEIRNIPHWAKNIHKLAARLIKNEQGVGAVEFALLVPVLLILYIGAVELSTALTVDKKVSKASAISTDILSKDETINKDRLKEMVGIAQSIVAPYDASSLGMVVIGIKVDSTGKPTISWSWNDSPKPPYPAGEEIVIPEAYKIPDTFFLKTTVNLDYHLVLLSPKKGSIGYQESTINLHKEYYLHQREAKVITCTDC